MFTPTTLIDVTTVTTREMLRKHKAVFERVKTTRQPAIVLSEDVPQVAIVSLDDLETLKQLRLTHSARALQDTAQRVRKAIQDEHERLPHDLATRHDIYAWEGEEAGTL